MNLNILSFFIANHKGTWCTGIKIAAVCDKNNSLEGSYTCERAGFIKPPCKKYFFYDWCSVSSTDSNTLPRKPFLCVKDH